MVGPDAAPSPPASEEPVHPLSPGTRVGAWRVKAWQGQGGYGAVYRAERVGWRRSEPGALKVSLGRWNWRMEREVELLSRLSHPGVPRLLDRGGKRSPSGDEYPFFVMEWVEGTPLYAWAEQHAPTGKQLCWVLAQVARALEAVHAAGAVHRDVKGNNILVRVLDRRAVLTDFGSCHFQGAERLTWQSLAPATPEYLSPQAVLFFLRGLHHPDSYYPPSPADDLYALGVTAYRLVMGQYPPAIDARQDEQGAWEATRPDPRPLLESNPQMDPRLREVIARLLSDAPEARGTAVQVAEALEASAGEEVRPEQSKLPVRARTWKPWLALAAAGACAVLLWLWRPVLPLPSPMIASTPRASDSRAPDAGTAAMGDTSPTQPQASTPPSTEKGPLVQEPLPEPRSGQARPDKTGQCPSRKQVAINGGCWVDVSSLMGAQDCAASGYVLFKGKCFVPANAPPKKPQPTSSPSEER
jgi:serine/threonine protein kinase